MLFVLCVSLSSCEAGGGVLTFVLTLVLMFITTATITEQKPRSTLLPSRRKTAPRHLWVKQPADSHKSQKRRFGSLAASERKAFRTRHNRGYPKCCVNRSKMQNEAVEFEPDGDLPPGFVIIYDTGHLLQW